MSTVIVNALGEQCPIPVVKATKALAAMEEPGTLEVHVDNEVAVQNVLRLAAGKNLPARSEKQQANHFVITLTVDAPAAAKSEAPEAPACRPDARGKTVVAVGSRTMGSGNDELGAVLMKGFLYALTQLEELPGTVLFFNGGAFLTCEGDSVADLKLLESQGVEILTCGTCLDFYHLKDRLSVGGVTNMYAIVEKLAAAEKVIRP